MALKLVLDQYEFSRYDYGRAVTFKIYDEDDAAFDCTNYTPSVAKIFKRRGDDLGFFRDAARLIAVRGQLSQVIQDITVSWTTQASGIGTFTFSKTDRPTITGNHWLEIELRDAADESARTVQISTELQRIWVEASEGD